MTADVTISHSNVEGFRRRLVDWWYENGREFPWRNTNNVFHILVSEIMLQRTKADQVIAVFNDFICKYPTPYDVVNASTEDISRTLFSLGLPQRIDHIIMMAKQIRDDFQGKVPETYTELRKLHGVGDYISSAVCCFGYKQPVIVVDTNTVRIVGRIFGVQTDAESRRKKDIREKHQFLLDSTDPRAYNYALLDLGALICSPKNPFCKICPIRQDCKTGNPTNKNDE